MPLYIILYDLKNNLVQSSLHAVISIPTLYIDFIKEHFEMP